MVYNLHNLASTIGWEIVNVDEGFINYEYVLKVGEIESLSYIVRISENQDLNIKKMMRLFV